jgi:hypothetical protein
VLGLQVWYHHAQLYHLLPPQQRPHSSHWLSLFSLIAFVISVVYPSPVVRLLNANLKLPMWG